MIVRNANDLDIHTYVHPRVIELYRRPFFKQGTEQWLEQRKSFLTASDVGAVLGNCIFKDRGTVHGQKIGTIFPEEQTEAMKHGTLTEPEARREYERITGNKVVQFGLLTGTEMLHFIGASVDGITTDGIVVEIKCPYSRKIRPGVVPSYYHDQVQTQLAVCDLDIAHYFEYNSFDGTHNLVEIKRDSNWLSENKRILMDFWAGMELEKRLQIYVNELDETEAQDFFTFSYMPKFAEFEHEKNNGNIQKASIILTHLGIACCHAGYAHYQRAISCFNQAVHMALSINSLEGFVFANLNRSLTYCEVGMKWYG
ncbi:MAG: lambda exonuclease family protein, partial [Candidatus Thalassarchaeaceae archaeon]